MLTIMIILLQNGRCRWCRSDFGWDSASNVMAGHETTLPITLDQMIYHVQCVVRGVDRALVVADLPF